MGTIPKKVKKITADLIWGCTICSKTRSHYNVLNTVSTDFLPDLSFGNFLFLNFGILEITSEYLIN